MVELCSICFENLEKGNIYGTSCGHVYHARCIQEWKTKNTTCPLCRQDTENVRTASPVSPILDALFVLNFFSNT